MQNTPIKERNAEIIKKYEAVPRISMAQIAREYNVSRMRICQIIQKHYKTTTK